METLTRQSTPQLGDVRCVVQLGDEGRPQSIVLAQLANAALPSCPWSYPLHSLYEILGVTSDGLLDTKIRASVGSATYNITGDDDWLNMLHDIWVREVDYLNPPVLRLILACSKTSITVLDEQFDAPREGHWLVREATRSEKEWEACCRFMRHPPAEAGDGRGKVLLGSRVRLSGDEMLDVYRYLQGITDGRMNGMVFSCPGRPSGLRVQLGIILCIRLSTCNEAMIANVDKQTGTNPGAGCTHGHPFGIECACQTESLTRKLARRDIGYMAVLARDGFSALAAVADEFFTSKILVGTSQYLTVTFATMDGAKLKDAATGQDLGEMPVLHPLFEATQNHIVILVKPSEAMSWLVSGAPQHHKPRLRASIPSITHLYIHDWTPTPHFKLELLIEAMSGRDMLTASSDSMSFSMTTPVCPAREQETFRPLARLCLPAHEAAKLHELGWFVQQGITYCRAAPYKLGCVASVRASRRVVEASASIGSPIRTVAENIQRLETGGPIRGLDALVRHHAIYNGPQAEMMRALGLLPPLRDIWPSVQLQELDESPAVDGSETDSPLPLWLRDIARLECCHLREFMSLVRDMRSKKAGPGHMVLLVPEEVLSMILTIWINEAMAEECIAVWMGIEASDTTCSRHVLNVIRQLAREEEEHIKKGLVGRTTVIVAPPASIDGYRHELGHVDCIVCFGEPWRGSEVNSIVSATCEGGGKRKVKELEIIWMSPNCDVLGLYLTGMQQG